MAAPGPVLVMGAGAIGCYVGGCLQAAGVAVHFVGRPPVLDRLRSHGLTLSRLDGPQLTLSPAQLQLHTEPPGAAALVLLCVKSADTAAAARQLPAGSRVLSLQNGVGSAATAAAAAPGLVVLPGMVPFGVTEVAPGHYHQGTAGEIAAQDDPALHPWLGTFAAGGVALRLHADLHPVQWGKLLLNLNNPLNALSGLPLRAQLQDRDFRRVLAALQREALAALRRAGITPAQVAALPPQRLPRVLSLPNWLFERVAARMLRIDPRVRSSMADDLARGRRTEVDALCGEVVRLARAHGGDAPLNARLAHLVETDPRPRSGAALRAELGI